MESEIVRASKRQLKALKQLCGDIDLSRFWSLSRISKYQRSDNNCDNWRTIQLSFSFEWAKSVGCCAGPRNNRYHRDFGYLFWL